MLDWENIRHFLAVARIGTLSGAARNLKVDHATVSRRLSALEEEIKTRLVERLPRACKLTPIGQRVFELAQGMEEDAYAIERFLDASRSPLSGKVSAGAISQFSGEASRGLSAHTSWRSVIYFW